MKRRRQFLMGAGGIAAGLATGAMPALAAEVRGPRYAMVVDMRRCIGCQACTVACGVENRVPAQAWRTVVTVSEVRTARGAAMVMLPRLCNHCDEPACVPPCPKKATYKTADGTVQIDADRCIGCGRCVKACPYGARYIDEETGTADKWMVAGAYTFQVRASNAHYYMSGISTSRTAGSLKLDPSGTTGAFLVR